MNWYELQKSSGVALATWSKDYSVKPQAIVKLAYTSKKHEMMIPRQNSEDGCVGHVALTESKNKITIEAAFYTRLYSFPLYEEIWHYGKEEMKRAVKTYNKICHVLEDLKADAEDEELPTPSIQGMAREELRFIDTDRKKPVNNASIATARSEPGEADWRNSLYGNRYPSPQISINNNGTINIINDRG